MGNRLLQVVGPHATGARQEGAAKAEAKLSLDVLAIHSGWPRRDLAFEGKKPLAHYDLLFGILGLLPALQQGGKLSRRVLISRRSLGNRARRT